MTKLLLARAPWRNTRSPATAIDPYPVPRLFAVQITRGPPLGHSFKSPVSFDMRVRSGPCHCGQSAVAWTAAAPRNTVTASAKALVISCLSFRRNGAKVIDDAPDVVVRNPSIESRHHTRWESALDNGEDFGVGGTLVPLIVGEIGRLLASLFLDNRDGHT